MKHIKKKYSTKYPRITIERMGWNPETGQITFIDLHDEGRGEAIFFGRGSAHRHGFMNGGKHDNHPPMPKKPRRTSKT